MFYSKCIKGSTHYLGDKQYFDVLSEGPLSGVSDDIILIIFRVSREFSDYVCIKSLTAGVGFWSILSVIYLYKFFIQSLFHAKLCKEY